VANNKADKNERYLCMQPKLKAKYSTSSTFENDSALPPRLPCAFMVCCLFAVVTYFNS